MFIAVCLVFCEAGMVSMRQVRRQLRCWRRGAPVHGFGLGGGPLCTTTTLLRRPS